MWQTTVVLLLLFEHAFAASSCALSGSTMPAAGKCEGPLQRSVLRQQYATEVNAGCKAGEVLYYKDGDTKQPAVRTNLYF